MPDITRRDFLDGALVAIGALTAPAWLLDCAKRSVSAGTSEYPPLLTGMRGSTSTAFETAHQLAWAGKVWNSPADSGETYDLVVVGAGISGLSAAHFYRKQFGAKSKILILDNHDDFGGHARRNEFHLPQVKLAYGGSQSLEDPYSYSKEAAHLLKELKVDLGTFERAYDLRFFEKHGLRDVTYFSAARYGKDAVVPFRMVDNSYTLPGLPAGALPLSEATAAMPLSPEAKRQIEIVFRETRPAFLNLSRAEQSSISYFDFLAKLGVTDSEVLHILRLMSTDETGIPADALSVAEASKNDLPGFQKAQKPSRDPSELYVHHFPDGNASIARLLVRRLMPHAASGSTMEDVVLSRFNYAALDQPGADVRLRLNSTVVHVTGEKSAVQITYVNDGAPVLVKARHCIMACYNAVIPYVIPDLPEKQKVDLKHQVKAPFVYTTVVLKNWHSMKKTGIGAAYCPGNLHHIVLANMPVKLGGHSAAFSPDAPMALNMVHVPVGEKPGTAPRDQFREGRKKLLSLSFSDFESEIKSHLGGMLGPGGFRETDIAAITVNRWGHGYSYAGSDLFDSEKTSRIALRAKKRFGRIAIANSDAGAMASADTAIDEAFRAVEDLAD